MHLADDFKAHFPKALESDLFRKCIKAIHNKLNISSELPSIPYRGAIFLFFIQLKAEGTCGLLWKIQRDGKLRYKQ